jgi:hypothetical protein
MTENDPIRISDREGNIPTSRMPQHPTGVVYVPADKVDEARHRYSTEANPPEVRALPIPDPAPTEDADLYDTELRIKACELAIQWTQACDRISGAEMEQSVGWFYDFLKGTP